MRNDLREIYERLEYAEEELATLERHLQFFVEKHFEVSSRLLPHGNQLIVRCRTQVPTRIHSRIKAIAQEIRASLDSLACVLAERNGKTTNQVYFPITKTEEYFATDAKEKLKKLNGPDRTLIMGMNSHGTANPFLFGMHQLDRMGKHHRLPLSRIAIGGLGGAQSEGPGELYGIEYHGDKVVSAQWQPVATVVKGSNITLKIGMAFAFAEPEQLAGMPAPDALKRFLAEAREIVSTFD